MPAATVGLRIGRGTNVDSALAEGRAVTSVDELAGAHVDTISVPGEIMLGPGDVLDWTFHGGGGWGDPLDADPASIEADVVEGRVGVAAAARIHGVVVADGRLDTEATEARRTSIRSDRRAWMKDAHLSARPEIGTAHGDRVGDHLMTLRARDGRVFFGCDCGHVLAPAHANWKPYAGHATLAAEDMGPKIRLHPDLIADGYACPACGALLAVEVRSNTDRPLHDFELVDQTSAKAEAPIQ
jgi:N-methylhydantoinase B